MCLGAGSRDRDEEGTQEPLPGGESSPKLNDGRETGQQGALVGSQRGWESPGARDEGRLLGGNATSSKLPLPVSSLVL